MNRKNTKYQQIYLDIKNQLLDGKYNSNEFLPSENRLMEQYNTSKDTIRKSLKLLEKDKLVKPVERKGYVILNNGAYISQVNKLAYQKKNIIHQIIDFREEFITEFLAEETGLKFGIQAHYIHRRTLLEGKPIFTDCIYIDKQAVPGLTSQIAKQSIYTYFNELNISTQCKHRIFNTRTASTKETDILELDNDQLIVDVKRFTYDDTGYVFEYSNTIFAPEYFEYFE